MLKLLELLVVCHVSSLMSPIISSKDISLNYCLHFDQNLTEMIRIDLGMAIDPAPPGVILATMIS